jgi:hypothetical protein
VTVVNGKLENMLLVEEFKCEKRRGKKAKIHKFLNFNDFL